MRSIWKGSLGFGMVAIPIKMFVAADDKRVGLLHNLHSECRSRLQQPKFCPTCSRQVEAAEVIKGFELDKEHYIPITEAELDNLKLESCHSIQIEGFVKAETLEDPRWVKDCYFLSPDEAGAKAFVLFTKAMQGLGVLGVSKIAIREKEQLCVVRPFADILLLQTLHWTDELRDYNELSVFVSVSDKEMQMATALIQAMTKDINLGQYKDEYREALADLIGAKLAGSVLEAPVVAKPKEMDIADAIMASLNAIGAGVKV